VQEQYEKIYKLLTDIKERPDSRVYPISR
jgi:hypothetical protein